MSGKAAHRRAGSRAPELSSRPLLVNVSKRLSGRTRGDGEARPALYEPGQSDFRRIEAGRWSKDVIRSGSWRMPDGRTFRVTPERL